ncbi:MAG: PA14 domain-containing protein [bacterium]|nr:PA14 domain-containing protein [bacterium]
MKHILYAGVIFILLATIIGVAYAQEATPPPPERRLHTIATAHLDTQWRWTIQETINEYIPSTFNENFKLFEAFPDYTFSFEGAFRYMLMKEYYPDAYLKLKKYIAGDRWRVAGSWVDAVDVNVPSPESLFRHALYGNGYFSKEFGKTSRDVLLPDCFGFGYALPSIAAHSGLKGFSTQKLTWGSSVGVPFDIGLWEGVDGSTLVAELGPGDYTSKIRSDLSRDSTWLATIDHQGEVSGLYAGYKYFGTGDVGGSPDSASVAWLEKSIQSDGPIKVISTGSDELSRTLTDDQKAKLPRYKGELLMTRHGVGCYSSEAAMKRWNRKNELLADAAEKAAVIADQLGGLAYPGEELKQTWIRFLWHQFHDDITGTSIPQAYQFSWNDELLCQNRFANIFQSSVEASVPALDTRTKGIPIVVFNPLSITRQDVVEAVLTYNETAPKYVRVYNPQGQEVAAQVAEQQDKSLKVVFLAEVPPVGYAVYDVRPSKQPGSLETGLSATDSTLENQRYKVTINSSGEVASIFDKTLRRELLNMPARLELLKDNPRNWPSWEIDYTDVMGIPRSTVRGRAQVSLVESGPARAVIDLLRYDGKSVFRQQIRLAAGEAGNRLEVINDIDWREPATLLKASFTPTSANDSVTYDLGLGSIKRGLNKPALYEVPGQQWADLTSEDGAFGVAVLNDSKYGWDHPDKNTLRLTLIHTPGVNSNWSWVQDERSQDLGQHRVTYAIAGHKGDWRDGEIPWEAARLNQPLLAFQTTKHQGKSGKFLSLLRVDDSSGQPVTSVAVKAVKLAEDSDEIVIRLQELKGESIDGVSIRFNRPILSAREINAGEEPVGAAELKNGMLVTSFSPYQPKSFAVRLQEAGVKVVPLQAQPLTLSYNIDGVSSDSDRKDGSFDQEGNTFSADLLPDTLIYQGAPFLFGPSLAGQMNVVECRGQEIAFPAGKYNRLYLLTCAVGGNPVITNFSIDNQPQGAVIPDYAAFLGQWNSRLVSGDFVEDPKQITPAYMENTPAAWTGTHHHNSKGDNVAYRYTNLFLVKLDLPPKSKSIRLPQDARVRIFAATLIKSPHDPIRTLQPLYDQTMLAFAEIKAPRRAFIDNIRVEITSPNPGARILYTTDGGDPAFSSTLYTDPLVFNRTTTVRARAFSGDLDGNYTSTVTLTRKTPIAPVEAVSLQPGLKCSYYAGPWTEIPSFNQLTPTKEVVLDSIMIPEFANDKNFAVRYQGYIRVPADGIYDFYTTSDDGSSLYIGDSLVVNNDGLHGAIEARGDIALKAGLHPLTITMFQGKGDSWLDVAVTGADNKKQPIPKGWLVH